MARVAQGRPFGGAPRFLPRRRLGTPRGGPRQVRLERRPERGPLPLATGPGGGAEDAVHAAVADRFEDDLWFFSDDPRILKEGERAKAEAVRRELGRRGKPETPGRIVAELGFGFWTSLFGSGYEQTLWPKLLKPVFPQATNRQRRRKALSVRLNGIRRLRNRVFHHEPVYQLPNLPRLHGEIVETIGWSSPAAEDLLRLSERFPEVHDGGPGRTENASTSSCRKGRKARTAQGAAGGPGRDGRSARVGRYASDDERAPPPRGQRVTLFNATQSVVSAANESVALQLAPQPIRNLLL